MIDTPCPEMQYSRAQDARLEEDSDGAPNDLDIAQSISGSNIDSGKLTTLLRIKFGAGAYNIRVSVKIPEQ